MDDSLTDPGLTYPGELSAADVARLRADPDFIALETQRSTLSWTLAILMMAIYGVFLVLVAFGKTLLAHTLGAGPVTLAFPLALGVILAAILLTGIYVARANTTFDRLTARIAARAAPRAAGAAQ